MMTTADWRKRAHDCMAASLLATDRDGQLQWQALSEAWLKCAELRDHGKSSRNETLLADSVAATDLTKAIGHADRLRARLALVTLHLEAT
jgi:hypothetical protein